MDKGDSMTASELKYRVESAGHEPHFFTRRTMRFFGDTMRNYGCRATRIYIRTGESVPVWELYRKRPVKHGLTGSAFFDRSTFERRWSRVERIEI
jgi:hypothetical protein